MLDYISMINTTEIFDLKSDKINKNFSNIDSNSEAFKKGQEYAESNPGLLTENIEAYASENGIEDKANFIFGYNSRDKKADNFDENTAKVKAMMPKTGDESPIYNGSDAQYFSLNTKLLKNVLKSKKKIKE